MSRTTGSLEAKSSGGTSLRSLSSRVEYGNPPRPSKNDAQRAERRESEDDPPEPVAGLASAKITRKHYDPNKTRMTQLILVVCDRCQPGLYW